MVALVGLAATFRFDVTATTFLTRAVTDFLVFDDTLLVARDFAFCIASCRFNLVLTLLYSKRKHFAKSAGN